MTQPPPQPQPQPSAAAAGAPEATPPAGPRDDDALGALASGDATARVAARGYNACEREGLLMLGGYDALEVPPDWSHLYG